MYNEWSVEEAEWRFDEMVEWRRYLHMHPELSYEETNTSNYIAEKLTSFGISIKRNIGGHGIVGIIKSSQGEGNVIALRADMDALPIQDGKRCEYRSTIPGVMHACGHDGHTATLLAVARLLQEHRDKWRGEVRLLFQPAEEVSPGGAQAMIKDGALQGVQSIYGVHLWTPLPAGEIATRSGPMMAAVDDFFVTIHGKGGHAGMPHACVDAVVIGAALVQQLQTIVSRNVSPLESAVVSVGSLQAGTTQNVIADCAILKGTVRSFDPLIRSLLRNRVESIIEHTCAMYDAQYELEYRIGYPALVNDKAEAERVFRVAASCFGEAAVHTADMMMPAEDFAYYNKVVPGCFIFVGAGNEQNCRYPHHHPMFDFEERAMLQAGQLLLAMAVDALKESRASDSERNERNAVQFEV